MAQQCSCATWEWPLDQLTLEHHPDCPWTKKGAAQANGIDLSLYALEPTPPSFEYRFQGEYDEDGRVIHYVKHFQPGDSLEVPVRLYHNPRLFVRRPFNVGAVCWDKIQLLTLPWA